MTPAASATHPPTITRPLPALVPLIAADLQHGREAAERAAMPHYRAAGEKLFEAKSQLTHGEFLPWVQRHFKISRNTAATYMRLAAQDEKSRGRDFSSLRDFLRETRNHTEGPRFQGRVPEANLNLARDELNRADEQGALRQVKCRVIDAGYKVVARECHPDRGGSAEAMARLNRARSDLKTLIGC